MRSNTPFPGFDSPGVGFEQPFAMLEACHERVQRSLSLLAKLVEHIDQHGHDAQSRSASADVLRYFDIAAPLHHEDEEVNVFPLLLDRDDAPLRRSVQTLQDDHRRMSAMWASVRAPLMRWSLPDCNDPVDAASRAAIESFQALYDKHIETEEKLVYPAARARLSAPELATMSRQMQARRQQ